MAWDPQDDIPDLSGRVILVTGGNVGLGAATIELLAPHNPATIYLCARRIPSAEAEVEKVKAANPSITTEIRILHLDLASFASIRKCAEEFNRDADRLDVLFLNAGISTVAPALTEEGYECQFGVNHIGHALLTQLLMPKMLETRAKKNDDVRIVCVSSMAAYIDVPSTGLALDKMKEANPLNSAYQRYGHSKLANMLFARGLAQTYPTVTSSSINPGQVYTELMSKVTGLNIILLYLFGHTYNWLYGVSPEKGAEVQVWASVSNDVKNGAFYDPGFVLNEEAKFFTDQKLTDELWEWTDKELKKHGAPGWPKA